MDKGHHRDRLDEQKLEESRREYAQLRASLLTFKKDRMGTNLDESNIEVQAKYSALQIQRQKFLNSMKNTKHRENETMARFNDFVSKLGKNKGGEELPKDRTPRRTRFIWLALGLSN